MRVRHGRRLQVSQVLKYFHDVLRHHERVFDIVGIQIQNLFFPPMLSHIDVLQRFLRWNLFLDVHRHPLRDFHNHRALFGYSLFPCRRIFLDRLLARRWTRVSLLDGSAHYSRPTGRTFQLRRWGFLVIVFGRQDGTWWVGSGHFLHAGIVGGFGDKARLGMHWLPSVLELDDFVLGDVAHIAQRCSLSAGGHGGGVSGIRRISGIGRGGFHRLGGDGGFLGNLTTPRDMVGDSQRGGLGPRQASRPAIFIIFVGVHALSNTSCLRGLGLG